MGSLLHNLWRQILRCATHNPLLQLPIISQFAREPKVGQLHIAIFVNQHIFGFEAK